ncbi:threonylcarbamoyl-AMP synthase [Candidatus Berkelbacteria bacterium]|nr:threonylcarbamoyl-AMP synthase [Candidatus Berkelbacteria bacterium]
MDILPINQHRPEERAIQAAVSTLRRGGILIYPTDTCYGLGCDARNVRAMARIAQLKGRAAAKKFSVIVRDVDSIEEITVVNGVQREIIQHYLPGPYTFVLLNADFRVASTNTLGVRVPDCAITQAIASAFGEPYITTSANRAGTGALYSQAEIRENLLNHLDLGHLPDLILDAGELPRTDTSTVVDLTKSPPVVLRQGSGVFTWPD